MKRIGTIVALFFALASVNTFAKTTTTNSFCITSQKAISSETAMRVLKLASNEIEYEYSDLVEMYYNGLVSIASTSEPNVYLVTVQEADGGIVEVMILDQM